MREAKKMRSVEALTRLARVGIEGKDWYYQQGERLQEIGEVLCIR